jgi:hypothetical protein
MTIMSYQRHLSVVVATTLLLLVLVTSSLTTKTVASFRAKKNGNGVAVDGRSLSWIGDSSNNNNGNGGGGLKPPSTRLFVDGSGDTYYDPYAQAWRLLGFYKDCNACVNNGGENANANANNLADCIQQGTTCQRYALWAAVSMM